MTIKRKLSIIKCAIVILFGILVFLMSIAVKDLVLEKETVIQTVTEERKYEPMIDHEESVIRVVEEVSPAVVSIIVTKDLPVFERRGFWLEEMGMERRETGGGSGFIISPDGLVLTNKHVVDDFEAEFAVLTSDERILNAEVVARDPIHDLAMLRIKEGGNFPTVRIGDPSGIRIGQTAIAIGNSLGEFRNTVSVGVVSGLGRSISATDGRTVRGIEDVIQTDAAINMGNSGGPLLNLRGEVIGINTAMALGAENIAFSVPIDKAERMIESVLAGKELKYPFLGVRYYMVDSFVKEEYGLTVGHGAFLIDELGEPAVQPGSAADRAGLRERDVIIEVDGVRIGEENHLADVILKYEPGDRMTMKVIRNGKELTIEAVLGEKN